MKAPVLAATAAALLVAATFGAPQTAEARGGYASAGIIGGLPASAIIGEGYSYYPGYPAPAYYPGPGYAAPTYPPPGCMIRQRPVAVYGSPRKIRVCY